MVIPIQLTNRLTAPEHEQLRELLVAVGDFMPRIYREAVLDYQESRGDDTALFGLRVYKHLRFAAGQFVEGKSGIGLFEPNGSYELAIGPLRIRIDLLGHFQYEDVLECFPDSSPTKVAVGASNYAQLRLEMPEVALNPAVADYSLNRLTLGHFGNPREGLVKWYLGAWINTVTGGRRWAWIERQDDIGGSAEPAPLKPRAPIVPFSQRAADVVAVSPRPGA